LSQHPTAFEKGSRSLVYQRGNPCITDSRGDPTNKRGTKMKFEKDTEEEIMSYPIKIFGHINSNDHTFIFICLAGGDSSLNHYNIV